MAIKTLSRDRRTRAEMPVVAVELPVMFEDEGQDEMGESIIHTDTTDIWYYSLKAHFRSQPAFEVCSNLNMYYHPIERKAYVTPDVFVVNPERRLRKNARSYRIGVTGPPPVLVGETLSKRSYQQQDLLDKPEIYAELEIPEYILVDLSGEFLPRKLLLKRRNGKGKWRDEQDADGGVTSRLGFRLIEDSDGRLRVLHATTGYRYLRPDEAEDRVEALEAELVRLRGESNRKPHDSGGKG